MVLYLGDTNLVGGQLAGNAVKLNVGGDLTVITLRDTSKFTPSQQAIDHNYLSATGQSGIAAGTGG